MMKMLLATEGSEGAMAAVAAAARFFRHGELEADLLCVVPHFHAPEPRDSAERRLLDRLRNDYRERMSEEADRSLAASLETLRSEGLEAHPRKDFGSPGDVILRWSVGYDVTVLGAHDRFGRTETGVGPVGNQVIGQCPTSILVGREAVGEGPHRILLCVDGSPGSNRALGQLLDRVRLEECTVGVMHVVEMPWLRFGLDRDWLVPEGHEELSAAEEAMGRGADSIVETAVRELRDSGVECEGIIREGVPEAQVLSEAEVGEYDLIVLGATGRSALTAVTLGSVSIRVATSAPATVWVVR